MAAADEEDGRGDFARLLGVEIQEAPIGKARGRIEVSSDLMQPYGIVHGGVYASLAETITSHATWLGVRDDGMIAMGQANNTTFLRPVTEGVIEAYAVARQRGRTTWVWDVEIKDSEERLCALVRMTVAVREQRR